MIPNDGVSFLYCDTVDPLKEGRYIDFVPVDGLNIFNEKSESN